ncbi:histone deacetylase family protein [Variovorax sp. PCZ-1]|uniref:histone deacetylase family protein n=1 Tax=Variovorax sp. PCZ-1 TaxID=2835533 RepID=UPI001BD114AB|nr:histone deacetylase family protein [Variovorax sp. PCZ-1]MBS7806872.1 histone deacetylase family protein [Variovorax sp. PCZ-1]
MGEGHPECPERLDAIADHLLATGLLDVLEQPEVPLASSADLELAHSRMHVAAVQGLRDRIEAEEMAGGPSHFYIDPDTAMNAHSWDAALRAAGAAVAATDAVIDKRLDNAFCSIRPPGHHAMHSKAMGFCLFNNIAIAAKHALERHGLKRVAVVDFDVHHGNGTEDILSSDPRCLMVGIFQHPFYPYSGEQSKASNMLNLPVPAYTRGMAVRELFEQYLLPKLEEFRPEMIFISAGFDAHRDDDLGQMGLVEADYEWMTERIVAVAKRHAKGRIVSCLEGGYNLNALARSVHTHVKVLAGL